MAALSFVKMIIPVRCFTCGKVCALEVPVSPSCCGVENRSGLVLMRQSANDSRRGLRFIR